MNDKKFSDWTKEEYIDWLLKNYGSSYDAQSKAYLETMPTMWILWRVARYLVKDMQYARRKNRI